MILGKDILPERKVYYLGSLVIESLNGHEGQMVDFFDTYHDVSNRAKISMNTFVLTLDWLFIIGLIKFNKGTIQKCS